jgi:transcriptional regulator with XRE-family HTH domain
MSPDIKAEVKELNIGGKIKELRIKRGMTLQHMAEMTGLSTPLLSQVENEVVAPPIATLLKISRSLEVPIAHFFQGETSAQKAVVVKSQQRKRITRHGYKGKSRSGYVYESLAYPRLDKKMEPFLVEFEVRARKDTNFFNHKGEEFGFVLEGKLELQIDEEIHELDAGDAYYFDSSLPHAFRALGSQPARAVCVVYSAE